MVHGNYNLFCDLEANIYELSNKCIFSVTNYLGSMFLLDIGKQIIKTGRKNKIYIEGELVISVRDCFWEIYKGNNKYLSCTDELNEQSFNFLIGLSLINIYFSENNFVIVFSNHIVIICDLTNKFEIDEGDNIDSTIISFSFTDKKQIYDIDARGNIFSEE